MLLEALDGEVTAVFTAAAGKKWRRPEGGS